MAEITRVSTPLIPKENLGFKNRPVTDMAFELNDTSKVHKPSEEGHIFDRKYSSENQIFRDNVGRASVEPLLRDTGEVLASLKKLIAFAEIGMSSAEITFDPEMKTLLNSLFIPEDEILASLFQQDKAQVLFKGEVFDQMREIISKFSEHPKIIDASTHLLKTIEKSINTTNSLRSIIVNSENLLAYMFAKDKEQFSEYLSGLAESLFPENQQSQIKEDLSFSDIRHITSFLSGAETEISQREISSLLKNNLLPLLGEVVVKYHQNENIRNIVMVIVHNIVRVDQGAPEDLREAISTFISELRQHATVSEDYQKSFILNVFSSVRDTKKNENEVITRMTEAIVKSFSSSQSSPAQLRQAENLLFNLMQNESSVMNLLHYVLPLQTQHERIFAELYIDPNTEKKKKGSSSDDSRRIFLTFDSGQHGSFEFLFMQTGNQVQLDMWCPQALVHSLGGMKRFISDIAAGHGYTISSLNISEFVKNKSIIDVFPSLLNRRIGVDVKI